MKEYSLQEFLQEENVVELDKIVASSNFPLEGNCLYQNRQAFALHVDNKEQLRKNLYTLCRDTRSIIEVGFNAGHSCALYLYSNPNIEVVTFDLCEHGYTEMCAEYLGGKYSLDFVKGDSSFTIPLYNPTNTFDLIHIDGGHSEIQTLLDIINCRKFAGDQTLLILDDAYLAGIEKAIEYLSSHNILVEINYESLGLAKTSYHRIFYYNRFPGAF